MTGQSGGDPGTYDGDEAAMSDLKVDYYALEDSQRDLSTLKSEFDGLQERGNLTADAWGHTGVRDAMHEFATNMDHNRRKLTEEMQHCGEKVQATLDAFRQTDAELAKSFDKERGK